MPKIALCELGDGEIRLAAEDQELGLTLAANEGLSTVRRKVAVVGFAAPDPRNEPEAVRQAYGEMTELPYYQPGELYRGQAPKISEIFQSSTPLLLSRD